MGIKLKCPKCEWVMDEEMEENIAFRYLEIHVNIEHVTAITNTTTNRGMREKMKKPKADLEMTEAKWRDFKNQWTLYKRASGVAGQEIVDDLWQCLSDPLRMEVTSERGAELESANEVDLLAAIRRMAVLESNPMVHRNNLRGIIQGESEKGRNYVARLREAAIDCKFSIKCTEDLCGATISYKEEIIRDQCVYGLRCKDTQAKILALGTELPTLEAVVAKIEAEEQAIMAQHKLTKNIKLETSTEVSGLREDEEHPVSGVKCKFCNRKGHGRNPDIKTRKSSCPAYGKICFKCNKSDHFATGSVCKSKKLRDVGEKREAAENNAAVAKETEEAKNSEPAQFFGLSLKVGHIDWDKESKHWVQRKPKSMDQMRVDIKVLVEDHAKWHPKKNFGKFWPAPKNSPGRLRQAKAIPDTGAQVTCAGPYLLQKLNMSERDLIPTSQKIVAANSTELRTLGGVMVEIIATKSGLEKATKQFCYICKEVKGLYLSRWACGDLSGVLPWSEDENARVQVIKEETRFGHKIVEEEMKAGTAGKDGNVASCGCPIRSSPPPLPETMPFKESQVGDLKQWLLDRYASSTFNVCTHQPLNKMTGPPLRFQVDPNVTPVAKHIPAPVPWHWREQVKEGLDADCRMGVVEKVPPNAKADWMARMVLTAKKDGSPRRTVDFSGLNKACKRQTHHTRSPYHLACDIPKNVKKSCYDAWNGYHSVPLEEKSKQYTKFITTHGAYQYKVCPQGWIASADAYSKRYDDIIKDEEDYVKCIDDVCQWDATVEGCFWKACKFLDTCARNGITLNPSKFVFAQDEVEYLGFVITPDAVKPGPAMIEAIREFPAPTNITEMRSFFGLVNQVSYAFSMKDTMAPFRELLRPSSDFYWDDRLQALFEEAREEVVKKVEKGVTMFEMDRVTCLAPDWSKEGVGFFMFQKYCGCEEIKMGCCKDGWHLVLAGSRFLKPNEKNWATGEGEALGVVYALQKTKYFTLGCKRLYIATDHKPLLGTFSDRGLEEVENPRLRKLKEKTMMYDFTMLHVPARKHAGPDALSRNPVCREGLMGDIETKKARQSLLAMLMTREESEIDDDPAEEQAVSRLVSYASPVVASMGIEVKAVTWERVQQATATDRALQEVIRMVREGFPDHRNKMEDNTREFFKIRDNLQVSQGVLLYNWRTVIPRVLRREVLEGLHAGHQGVVSMRARAAESVFWPGLDRAIQDYRDRCRVCDYIAPSQANEPPITADPPVYPFQQVCSDYFSLDGSTYLVIVDRYSGWPSVMKVGKDEADSKGLIKYLRSFCETFGVPEEISTDGQSSYVSQETKEFLRAWGIKHRVSSSYHAHSNTRAELGVKAMKRMLRGNMGPQGGLYNDKFARALLSYRNTPMQGIGLSPAQIIFGRKLKDTLPFAPGGEGRIHKEWRITAEDREKALARRHAMNVERLNEHVKKLKDLEVGQSVAVQNQYGNHKKRWGRTGTVVEVGPGPGQYLVKMDGSRKLTLRNRKFLRTFKGVADVVAESDHLIDPQKEQVVGQDDQVQGEVRETVQPQADHQQVLPPGDTEEVGPGHQPQQVDTPGLVETGGEKKYPRRERRRPAKLRDFEVDITG